MSHIDEEVGDIGVVVEEPYKAARTTTLTPCFIRTGEMTFSDIQRGKADRLTVAYGRLAVLAAAWCASPLVVSPQKVSYKT